jgi:hypothetical protein
MSKFFLISLFTFIIFSTGYSQTKLRVEFRVDKQSMSTPMSFLEDAIFTNYFYSRPVNIKFNGSNLDMYYDNGETFIKKNVTEVAHNKEYDNDRVSFETILFTDKAIATDTITYIIDHSSGFVQIILPAKNSKGDNVGFTSFKKFTKGNELASR